MAHDQPIALDAPSAWGARRQTRRELLHGTLALASLSVCSGCGIPSLLWSQTARIPRIGYLAVGTREGVRAATVQGFLGGLGEHGYDEGRNILIEYRFSGDRNELLPALAAELVDLEVDLIVAAGTPASVAAKQSTGTIPIVMGALASHPVELGFVASLNRPGG